MELDVKLITLLSSRGDAKVRIGDFDGAFEDYSKYVETYPEFRIYLALGEFKLLKQDYAGSVALFTKAIEMKPWDPLGYRKRAVAYRAMNDLKRAKADEKKAAKLSSQ